MKKLILTLAGITLFVFCSNIKNKNILLYENIKFDGYVWDKDSIYSFTFDIKDTLNRYNIYFDLRNNNKYPFSNIFLFTELVFKSERNIKSNSIKENDLQYIMASPDGKWLGSGLTNVKKNIFLYESNFKFSKIGKYEIKVVQGMRKDKLEGLESISLILEKNI